MKPKTASKKAAKRITKAALLKAAAICAKNERPQ